MAIEKDGRHQATDEQPDLYGITLSKGADQWIPVAEVRGFAKSLREANCSIVSEKGISDGVLKTLLETTGKKVSESLSSFKDEGIAPNPADWVNSAAEFCVVAFGWQVRHERGALYI
ncbi:MAG: hypothetical protein ABSC55_13715 [Syntrophorhabdales bacterium]